jgi:hypothetical protein
LGAYFTPVATPTKARGINILAGSVISNQPSPVTDLEYPFAIIARAISKGCSKAVIGDG